jgi:hypothetical protein
MAEAINTETVLPGHQAMSWMTESAAGPRLERC